MHERSFVLLPLVEIVPEFVHPILGNSIQQLWELCLDSSQIQKLD